MSKPHGRSKSFLATLLFTVAWAAAATADERPTVIVPDVTATTPRDVPPEAMQRVYDEVKTPFKYGIILRGKEGRMLDCPNVFGFGEKWYMVYVGIKDKVGYETFLAESDDLVHWNPLGAILPFVDAGWDRWQAAGGLALVDHQWGGSASLQSFNDKYWITYIGGAKQGYETDPLAIGLAWTTTPTQPTPWHRHAENPILAPDDSDARPFEQETLYKSNIIWDKSRSLGYPFVMFYNAKQRGDWIERVGMAVSNDMVDWSRYGKKPVIDNGKGISGDPQVVRMGDLWVMFYFGAGWQPRAFDTFACSYDLVHWTKWTGPHILEPSEPWDKTYAHKPWLIKHNGVVYHFYCAVGDQGRAIALATSKPLNGVDAQPSSEN